MGFVDSGKVILRISQGIPTDIDSSAVPVGGFNQAHVTLGSRREDFRGRRGKAGLGGS